MNLNYWSGIHRGFSLIFVPLRILTCAGYLGIWVGGQWQLGDEEISVRSAHYFGHGVHRYWI